MHRERHLNYIHLDIKRKIRLFAEHMYFKLWLYNSLQWAVWVQYVQLLQVMFKNCFMHCVGFAIAKCTICSHPACDV